jgi:hypothetical protein
MMLMMATTISSSISVKPSFRLPVMTHVPSNLGHDHRLGMRPALRVNHGGL